LAGEIRFQLVKLSSIEATIGPIRNTTVPINHGDANSRPARSSLRTALLIPDRFPRFRSAPERGSVT
jgi:hypothetical protein